MAKQSISIGTSANDGTGDPLRTAFNKINSNFDELYGADNNLTTLDNNLDVGIHSITTGVTNGNITVTPNGTGSINLGAVKFNGTTISSDDSTQITIAENIQTTGALVVAAAGTIGGALAANTSLSIAGDGATVTGIKDEDNMASNSDVKLATQQSIKAYADTKAALTGTTNNTITTVTGANAVQGEANLTFDGSTLAVTGAATVSTTLGVTGATTLSGGATVNGLLTAGSLTTNEITSNGSNADLTINPSGIGNLVLGSITLEMDAVGTKIVSNDSSAVTFGEGVNVLGAVNSASADISGALNIGGDTTGVNQTLTGSLTTGTLNVGDLNILADGTISTDTNGDVVIDPAGTGAIVLTGPITATGTQTTTGQLNVDNLRLDGNTLSAQTGGITLSAATGQNVTVSGTGVKLTAAEANFTLMEATTVRTDKLEIDTSNGDLSINTQGTGTVDFNTPTQTTIGSAGGASAIPGAPTGYLKIKIAGTLRVIPFYDQA
jgi:hypothetical protein